MCYKHATWGGLSFFLTQVIKFLIAKDREGVTSYLHWRKSLMRFGAISQHVVIHCSLLWLHYPAVSFPSFPLFVFHTLSLHSAPKVSEWRQLYTYRSSSNPWWSVWKDTKVMACCEMSGIQDIIRADKRQQRNEIHGETCNLKETSYTWTILLGFWQNHRVRIKGESGGNTFFCPRACCRQWAHFSCSAVWKCVDFHHNGGISVPKTIINTKC